jgi:hypothetical protein
MEERGYVARHYGEERGWEDIKLKSGAKTVVSGAAGAKGFFEQGSLDLEEF